VKPPRRPDLLWAVMAVWAVALALTAVLALLFVVKRPGPLAGSPAAEPDSPALVPASFTPTQTAARQPPTGPASPAVTIAAAALPVDSTPPTGDLMPPTGDLMPPTGDLMPPTGDLMLPTPSPAPYHTPTPSTTPAHVSSAHPGFADVTVIGYSAAGRPLEVFRFGAGEVERMIVAGIHGGYEWNTIALADALIAHLQQNPELIPPEVTLFILRSLNPDGEARARGVNGHDNEDGVDLNRNWPSHWKPDWPRDGCWKYTPVTGGEEPGSEPETQALMSFLLGSRVDGLISYHSAVLGIFAGGQPPDEASLRLAEAAAAVSPYPYPPIDTGCQFTGQLIDWASDNGIAAIDVELQNHRHTDFEINLRVLEALLGWRR
jgi:predicted deacylase